MLNFTLNLRYTVDARAHSSSRRKGGGGSASVRDRCDKSVVATILCRLSCDQKASACSAERAFSSNRRFVAVRASVSVYATEARTAQTNRTLADEGAQRGAKTFST